MNRRFLAVAAFAIWAQWSAAFAQTIEVPALTPLGQPIVAKVELPEGGKVVWKADAGSSVINAGKGRAYVWAAPGGHQLQAVVAPGGDGSPAARRRSGASSSTLGCRACMSAWVARAVTASIAVLLPISSLSASAVTASAMVAPSE